MIEINNLIYSLEINFVNKSGLDSSISIKFQDNGLKIKSVRIGNVCITEETINGRVLSGRIDNSDGYCGYRYDYQNGENLLNINPNISLDTAISLINKTKMKSDFLTAKLVLSSVLRSDYRVVILNKGSLNIIKTVSVENEKSEHCTLQESVDFLKLDGEGRFVEQDRKTVYKIDDNCVVEETKTLADSDIKFDLIELSAVLSQNPQNYKQLIEIKNQIQKHISNNSINGEKTL